MEVNETDTIKFICEVSKPGAEVTWFKGDQELPEGGRVEQKVDGRKRILIIHNATLDDAGPYSCKLPNAQTTGKLKVNGEKLPLISFRTREWLSRQ